MTSSIFARNISTGLVYTPRELISDEIHHLKGMGQSRWRTNPFMATCRTVGGMVFLVVLILYFLNPFQFAIHKTEAINAYLYLVRFGNPAEAEPLRSCGMFSERDWTMLEQRAQLAESESVKPFFISTSDAQKTIADTVAYMREVDALASGDVSNASPLTKVRFYLFRQFGIIPPREWMSLNPVIDPNQG